jgi:peptidoglycan/xylan/chitin deacetylase (PgdA/CDA1 family)
MKKFFIIILVVIFLILVIVLRGTSVISKIKGPTGITLVSNKSEIVVTALSYHIIKNNLSGNTVVNITNFANQMAELNSNGFSTITYDQWYNWTKGLIEIPEKSVIIIFDDGENSTYTNAAPIMENYGYVGVVSLITSTISGGNSDEYMNWSEINDLKNKGWQIASHSVDHLDITTLNYNQRQFEFNNSKNTIIEEINVTPTLFVYPYNINTNITDSECALYYNLCSGYSSENISGNFIYEYSNYTHESLLGLSRVIITNETTIQQFKDILIANLNFNANVKVNKYKYRPPIT